jgi:hypothetical protein
MRGRSEYGRMATRTLLGVGTSWSAKRRGRKERDAVKLRNDAKKIFLGRGTVGHKGTCF